MSCENLLFFVSFLSGYKSRNNGEKENLWRVNMVQTSCMLAKCRQSRRKKTHGCVSEQLELFYCEKHSKVTTRASCSKKILTKRINGLQGCCLCGSDDSKTVWFIYYGLNCLKLGNHLFILTQNGLFSSYFNLWWWHSVL